MGSDIKRRLIIFSSVVLVAIIFLLPTIFKQQFKDIDWISKPIGLGLDLSGGVHLVYEVESKEAVKSRLQVTANSIRSDLRKAKVAVTRVVVTDKNTVEFTLFREKTAAEARALIVRQAAAQQRADALDQQPLGKRLLI